MAPVHTAPMSAEEAAAIHKVALELSNGIEKSASDSYEYRSITLPNKLQVLLVHDAKAEKAAAAMDVNVGNFSDPEDIPGLAHFLEHMLFLGTEKFPDENSYSSFLSEHGGRSNAYTSMENTNYYFDVGHASLEGALDRFAQFFIAPLFTADATDRELNAVDSEHAKNLQDDGWRMFQLEKSTSNSRHPYHKFATGDSKTLNVEPQSKGIDVRRELLDFHARYYSANRMKLVIFGREDLGTLEQWAREYFGPIENSDAPPLSYGPDIGLPIDVAERGRRIDMVPVKDLRTIEISWALPPLQDLYQEGPERYISNLVGHEGPGSIFACLKKLGYANELSAGLFFGTPTFSMFKATVDCTEAGIEHVDAILAVVFGYLKLLREDGYSGVQGWIWREVAMQAANSFRFRSQSQPSSLVSRVASNMHRVPAEHVLSSELLRKYDRDSIVDVLNELTPERAQVLVASRNAEAVADLSERWYGTKHAITKFDPKVLSRWQEDPFSLVEDEHFVAAELHLPHPNDFLPSNFTIHPFSPVSTVDVETLAAEVRDVSPLLVEAVESASRVVSFQLDDRKRKSGRLLSPSQVRMAALGSMVERDALQPWAVSVPANADEADDVKSGAESHNLDMDIWRPPVLIAVGDEVGGLLWHKQDCVFGLPKAMVAISIRTPAAYQDPRASVLSELYTVLVQDMLSEFAYDAEIAGLFYHFRNTTTGVHLTVGGFVHKLDKLLERVTETMCSPEAFTDKEFQRFKKKMTRDLQNFDMEQAYQHCMYTSTVMLNLPRWHIDEKLKVIGDVTLPELKAHVRAMLKTCSMETLVTGNVTAEHAMAFARQTRLAIGEMDPASAMDGSLTPRVVMIEPRSESFFMLPGRDPDNINSAIEVILQVGPDDPHRLAPLQLLAQIAQEPCFNKLRTEQQLGYIVFCGVRGDHGINALRFLVQSSRADPYMLDEKIEDFIAYLGGLLEDLDEDALRRNIDAVLDSNLERDKTLFAETRRWAGEIEHHFYRFSRAVELAASVSTTTKADLLEFFNDFIHRDGKNRRKLVVGIFGAKHQSALPTAARTRASHDNDNATLAATHALQTRNEPAVYQVANIRQFRTSNSLFPVQSRAQNKL